MEIQTESTFKKQWFRIAGYSGIVISIAYVFNTIVYTISGFPLPESATDWVVYLEGKTTLWWCIIWLSIITNILYLPFAYGLYECLKKTHKTLMMIAGGLFTLFVFLELAITWTNYPTIIGLFHKYLLAGTGVEKERILSAIEYASASFQTPATGFYFIVIPALAAIIVSLALLKSKVVGKMLPWIGIISGVCNIISVWGGIIVPSLEVLVVPGSFLILFWFGGIGMHLITFSKKVI